MDSLQLCVCSVVAFIDQQWSISPHQGICITDCESGSLLRHHCAAMCRYLANRPAILSGLRVALHAFLAYFVCHQPVESYKWLDTGGLGPLCVIPMGLMVSFTPLPNLLTFGQHSPAWSDTLECV